MPRRQRTKPIDIDASDLPDLTAQQHEFVQHILAGKTASDAYRLAYDTDNMKPATINAEASRLNTHPKISAWVTAGRMSYLGTSVLTKDMHLAELTRLREMALASGNIGAAVAAEQTRGKVAGHHIERIQEVPADPVETLRDLYRTGTKDAQTAAIAMAEQHGIPLAAITEQATQH